MRNTGSAAPPAPSKIVRVPVVAACEQSAKPPMMSSCSLAETDNAIAWLV
ncbi:MAG TPA: hypothetical protein VFS55_14300 [Dokdonella sp.]|nr:hypothetical protein [Dokdonella sp.]